MVTDIIRRVPKDPLGPLTLIYMGEGGNLPLPQAVFWLQLKNGWR